MKIFFLILIFIKLNRCSLYIDFKNYIISPGVNVHHGYFLYENKYQMFTGINDSISLVRFGDQPIFPIFIDPLIKYNLIVEHFECSLIKFIILHVSCIEQGKPEYNFTIKFEIREDSFVYLEKIPDEVLKTTIFISLDIDDYSINHPFISVSSKKMKQHSEFEFRVIKSFRGVELDGVSAPRYSIGYVYDISTMVLLGLFLVEDLIHICNSVLLKIRETSRQVLINYLHYKLKYEKIEVGLKSYWSYFGTIREMFDKNRLFAINAKLKCDRNYELSPLLNLEVSETFKGNQLYIRKTTGIAIQQYYTFYESNDPRYNIQSVINTLFKRYIIYKVENDKCLCVERFIDKNNEIILINLEHKVITNIYITVMLIRRSGSYCYKRIDGDKKQERLKMLQDDYPIFLNIDIDEESSIIYTREKLNDDEFNFFYFYINKYDHCINLIKKYKFRRVYEIKPYYKGNIPRERYSKDYRIIREKVDSSEILVRNPFDDKPLDVSSYEVYVPIQ